MSELTLITCTNQKRDESAPAKKLYDKSTYFRAMRSWAEARGDPWYILSAKHGLVIPTDDIEPYDDRGLNESQAVSVADKIADGYDTVHICAGRDYTDHLIPELEQRGVDVVEHFAGQRIGTRISNLQKRAAELQE